MCRRPDHNNTSLGQSRSPSFSCLTMFPCLFLTSQPAVAPAHPANCSVTAATAGSREPRHRPPPRLQTNAAGSLAVRAAAARPAPADWASVRATEHVLVGFHAHSSVRTLMQLCRMEDESILVRLQMKNVNYVWNRVCVCVCVSGLTTHEHV